MYDDWHRHLAPLLRTKVGKAWEKASRESEVFGVRTYEEWERLIELADPSGGPVPMAVAIFSRGEDFGFQGLLGVTPGFVERATALGTGSPAAGAGAAGSAPSWSVTATDQGLEFTFKEHTGYGRLDGGWLRVGADKLDLIGGRGAGPVFTSALEDKIRTADLSIFMVGGGRLSDELVNNMEPGPLGAMLKGVTGFVVTATLEDTGTYVWELAGDAPVLKLFGPTVRKPDLANKLAAHWDADATGFLSLSLPPPVLQQMAPLLGEALADAPVPPPASLMSALGQLEGRLGFASFGSPGDWGGGIEFANAGAAADAVRGLHGWLKRMTEVQPTEAAKSLRLELTEPAGRGPVLHISPDLEVEGVSVFAKGTTLLVTAQTARYDLAKQSGKGAASGGLLRGPLTPGVRATLADPAMILAYSVLGSDARLFDGLAWLIKPAEIALEMFAEQSPEAQELLGGSLRRAGAQMVASGFVTLMFYDVAFAADVDDGLLTLRFASSLL